MTRVSAHSIQFSRNRFVYMAPRTDRQTESDREKDRNIIASCEKLNKTKTRTAKHNQPISHAPSTCKQNEKKKHF